MCFAHVSVGVRAHTRGLANAHVFRTFATVHTRGKRSILLMVRLWSEYRRGFG